MTATGARSPAAPEDTEALVARFGSFGLAKHGHEPKNKFGESLFAVTVADGLQWARTQQSADVVHLVPRYNPWWSRWLLRVPLVREVVTWNLVLVLRRR